MKTKIDYNSSRNQDIKGQFVRREVIHNASMLLSHLITREFEQPSEYYDELMALGSQPDYESAAEYAGWEYDDEEEVWRYPNSEDTYDDVQELCDSEGLDYDYYEPYEYWIVSDRLGKQLKDRGQIVEEVFGLTIWGRCTTGQAILLDHVISEICSDMEILEGQRYEWK